MSYIEDFGPPDWVITWWGRASTVARFFSYVVAKIKKYGPTVLFLGALTYFAYVVMSGSVPQNLRDVEWRHIALYVIGGGIIGLGAGIFTTSRTEELFLVQLFMIFISVVLCGVGFALLVVLLI